MRLAERVPLAPLTSLKLGGPARYFVDAQTVDEVVAALAWARSAPVGVRLLGGGSNLVVGDGGVDELVLRPSLLGVTAEPTPDGVEVTAGAGEPWDPFVRYTVEQGWAGLECLSGIPGRVGATPVQNVGAYGREVGELITRVTVLDRASLTTQDLPHDACAFAYRDSAFKGLWRDQYVVLAVTYRLEPAGTPTLRYAELTRHLAARGEPQPSLAAVRAAVLELRAAKSMLEDPAPPNGRNCGSFFVNPIVPRATYTRIAASIPRDVPHYDLPDERIKIPAAFLIEQAGFTKGMTDGPVGLSTAHTLCIVAHEGATTADVLRFARRIRAGVAARFGVELVPEPEMWGFSAFDAGLPTG